MTQIRNFSGSWSHIFRPITWWTTLLPLWFLGVSAEKDHSQPPCHRPLFTTLHFGKGPKKREDQGDLDSVIAHHRFIASSYLVNRKLGLEDRVGNAAPE